MATFDLEKHIESHSEKTINGLDEETQKRLQDGDEYLHFKMSIDTAQFIAAGYTTQEEIDEVMKNILDTIKKEGFSEKVLNRKKVLKSGETKEYYKDRKTSFEDTLMAYHAKDLNQNYTVEPHFHFFTSKYIPGETDQKGKRKKRSFGNGYSSIRYAFQDEASKYGLVFHFADAGNAKKDEIRVNETLKTTTGRFSWQMQRMTDEEFVEYFTQHADEARRRIELSYQRTVEDGNVQFYIKTMRKIQERLRRTDTDFDFGGANLKNAYTIPLTEEHHQTIAVLASGDISKINALLRAGRDNMIARDYVKFCYGFDAPIINTLNATFDETLVIRPLPKEQIDVSGMTAALKELYAYRKGKDPKKEVIRLKDKLKEEEKEFGLDITEEGGITEGRHGGSTFNAAPNKSKNARNNTGAYYESVKTDILESASVSTNEKEFKAAMIRRGYEKAGFRSRNKKNIGIRFQNARGKTQYIYFDKIGMEFSDLTAIFMRNMELLRTQDAAFMERKQKDEAQRKIKSRRERQREKEKEASRMRLVFEQLNIAYTLTHQQRKLYDTYNYITPFELKGYHVYQNAETKAVVIGNKQKAFRIIDKGNGSILAKGRGNERSEYLEERARLMYEVAMAKGWDVRDIRAEGSNAFVRMAQEIKTELLISGGSSSTGGLSPEPLPEPPANEQ